MLGFGAGSGAKAILDAVSRSQAIIEFKPDGTIIRANENFCNAVGYEISEISGQHHRMFPFAVPDRRSGSDRTCPTGFAWSTVGSKGRAYTEGANSPSCSEACAEPPWQRGSQKRRMGGILIARTSCQLPSLSDFPLKACVIRADRLIGGSQQEAAPANICEKTKDYTFVSRLNFVGPSTVKVNLPVMETDESSPIFEENHPNGTAAAP